MFCIHFSSLTHISIIEFAAQKLHTELPDWERDIWKFLDDWFNPGIRSVKVFTSGSTGAPKPIEHSRQAMLHSARMTCNALQLQKGDNALLCLPVTKIAGMMMLVRSLHVGLNLYCIEPSATPLKGIPAELPLAFAAFTPMQLHSAKNDYPQFLKAEAIRKIILGGEPVSAEVLSIVRKFTNDVYATFGMTETISHIALKKLNGTGADEHFKLLPGIKIATGEDSRLIIKAPEPGQPDLVTNDMVRIVSENEFDWLGRTDNVINTGGVKIYPEEIEQQLQKHIHPAYFIAALPDERTGEQLVLAIEMEALSESDKRELNEIFAPFPKLHRPKKVLLFRQFERTPNRKVLRKETLQNSFETYLIPE